MFAKLSAIALALPAVVSALTVDAPTTWTSGGPANITWTSTSTDPASVSFELVNTVFNNAFAIANNIPVSQGMITLGLPIVPPGSGYTLEAVAPGNINQVFASSGSFSIGAIASVSTTSASTITGSTMSMSGTVMPTTTTPSTSSSSTMTSTSATTKPSSFNAASSMKFGFNANSVAVILLSVAAGAAAIF